MIENLDERSGDCAVGEFPAAEHRADAAGGR